MVKFLHKGVMIIGSYHGNDTSAGPNMAFLCLSIQTAYIHTENEGGIKSFHFHHCLTWLRELLLTSNVADQKGMRLGVTRLLLGLQTKELNATVFH